MTGNRTNAATASTRALLCRAATLIMAALAVWLAAWGIARAEPRLALVIGNSAYRSVTPLPNAAADGALLAAALAMGGFDVALVRDADADVMQAAIADFAGRLRAAGPETTAFLYFAGHGLHSGGADYLLPVDAALWAGASPARRGLRADALLADLRAAGAGRAILMLDACRDDPFMPGSGGLSGITAPEGTFVGFAAAPGAVAFDGGADGHSPFAASLAAELRGPAGDLDQIFARVAATVSRQTGGVQAPWAQSGLGKPVQVGLASGQSTPAADELAALGQAMSLASPGTSRGLVPVVDGKLIQDLVKIETPQYPPIEGLPDEVWKGQHCSNCHNWTPEALCAQGNTYLTETGEFALDKQHPLDGFKQLLREWARGGCQ